MSRGAHAAPKTRRAHAAPKSARGAAATAARTALVRTGAFSGALAITWGVMNAVTGQGVVDAFAAEQESAPQAPAGTVLAEDEVRKIEALNKKYACSSTGLGKDVIPARTVVRVDGEVRLASFDEGWAIHLGDVPGTLVSVCAR